MAEERAEGEIDLIFADYFAMPGGEHALRPPLCAHVELTPTGLLASLR